MIRPVLLTLAIAVASACGCSDRVGNTQPADTRGPLAAEVSALVSHLCGAGESHFRETWDAYERLVLASLRDPTTADADIAAALAMVDVPDEESQDLWIDALRVAPDLVVLVAGHQCDFSADGGRVSIFRGSPDAWMSTHVTDAWRVTDRLDIAGPGVPWRVAASREAARLFIAVSTTSTQAEHSDLYLLDVAGGPIRVVEKRTNLLDVERPGNAGGPTGTLRWHELPRNLTSSFDANDLPRFEAQISLDADPPLRIVSTTPWLDALERACDPAGRQTSDPVVRAVPCGADLVSTHAYAQAGLTEVVLRGSGVALPCGPGDFAQEHADMVEDSSAIVTLREAGPAWLIVGIRPRNRSCAARGARLPDPSVIPEPGVEVLATLDHPLSMGGSADGLYWSADPMQSGDVHARGPLTQIGMASGDSTDFATAIVSDRTYVYRTSAATGDIIRSDSRGRDRAIARPDGGVVGLAIDGDDVLWTVPGDVDGDGLGELRRLHAGAVDVVARDLAMPMGVAVQGRAAIVATADGLVRVPLDGQRAEPVFEAISPIGVAVSGTTVAWTEATGRVVVARGDGRTRVVSSNGRPTDIVVRTDRVIWLDVGTGEVRAAQIDGP